MRFNFSQGGNYEEVQMTHSGGFGPTYFHTSYVLPEAFSPEIDLGWETNPTLTISTKANGDFWDLLQMEPFFGRGNSTCIPEKYLV